MQAHGCGRNILAWGNALRYIINKHRNKQKHCNKKRNKKPTQQIPHAYIISIP